MLSKKEKKTLYKQKSRLLTGLLACFKKKKQQPFSAKLSIPFVFPRTIILAIPSLRCLCLYKFQIPNNRKNPLGVDNPINFRAKRGNRVR